MPVWKQEVDDEVLLGDFAAFSYHYQVRQTYSAILRHFLGLCLADFLSALEFLSAWPCTTL